MSTDPESKPFTLTIDPHEGLGLPVSFSGNFAPEQLDRWESVGGQHASYQDSIDAVERLVCDPRFTGGTLAFCERDLDAIIVRESYRALGFEAERIHDTAGEFEDPRAVVISSAPFITDPSQPGIHPAYPAQRP